MEVEKQLYKNKDKIFAKVKPKLEKQFQKRKNEMLEAFDEHPVTQELEGGENGGIGLVETAHGGNLFSLLGFNAGNHPAENLRKILESNILLKSNLAKAKKTKNRVLFEVPVEIPTMETIGKKASAKNSLSRWTTKSWIDLVENGIPWFAHYLFKDGKKINKSASGTAIEVKAEIEQGRTTPFNGIPYISQILRDFKNSFK